eukprot:TRINITY_DN4211_c0_g1_i4.p3 TRINITY_DN4211_c0_g1~~TRINITY_DN4211_c0_g1_i4.p3  ORF type:complete len:62 (+),score=7.07 TRINITY_DN4211_c0_g1_i4:110-295(+)
MVQWGCGARVLIPSPVNVVLKNATAIQQGRGKRGSKNQRQIEFLCQARSVLQIEKGTPRSC